MSADLPSLLARLRDCRWIDLTHAFGPGIPHFSGFPDERRTRIWGFREGEGSAGTGFAADTYELVGQWGTHVDPPAHFVEGGRTQDEIPVTEMILELVVLDVREQVARDPGHAAGAADVEAHEARHGPIPGGSFVALRTGAGELWPATPPNGPGWSVDALRLLVEERGVTAIGHDTTDTDPSALVAAGSVEAEAYLLGADRWQIELLANLGEVPERGALIVATWPKPLAGTGFPARCFAICD
jgi:kynurenine formamidase